MPTYDYRCEACDHEFELLLSSIRSDGFTTPVIVLHDGTIVDGFHRWKAADG